MFDPNQHMIKLKGKDYLQVAWRLVWFRDPESGFPLNGIRTELLEHGEDWAVFKAEIIDDNGFVLSTGHGSESAKDFPDYLEKAETKAVGRALAMLGFGTQFAADELDEGDRIVDSPIDRTVKPVIGGNTDIVPICSKCGKKISEKVHDYSVTYWGKPLCVDCQKTEPRKKDG